MLGLSGIRGFDLHLWSRKANAEGVERWVQCRVIELQKLLPVAIPLKRTIVTGFAEEACVIFMSTDVGAFVIELKTGRARKVARPGLYHHVIPFSIFYTPGTVSGLCLFVILHCTVYKFVICICDNLVTLICTY